MIIVSTGIPDKRWTPTWESPADQGKILVTCFSDATSEPMTDFDGQLLHK